ncbi:hypothetical protein BJY04DRAFT_19070 [Aspergillus karnatakaensis]|uniref:uncharacterized protein n=1 Tax=Aspergillus karnatakaensis TaxID=1810916 RepID=UPI003CCDC1EC
MSALRSERIDLTNDLDRSWYNYIDPDLARQNEQSPYSSNVQQLQSAEEPLDCSVSVSHDGRLIGNIPVSNDNDEGIKFSVCGGAEIPHFKLVLSLRTTRRILHFTAIWTAWGERDLDSRKPLPDNTNTIAQQMSYTFSDRLQNVKATLV